jgi:ABC-2 type transport system permease protein
MRLWAGERRSGTVEILLTLPFSEVELVMGKFISTLILLLFLFALSLPVPLSLFALGDFDRMLALTEYIGAILLSSLALAMSLFFSCLFKSQAASFLGTTALLALLMFINYLVPGLQYISLSYHFESFAKGLLDSRGLLYFILGTVLFLYLNVQVLHLRREE